MFWENKVVNWDLSDLRNISKLRLDSFGKNGFQDATLFQ